ncbi:MAG: aminomethyl-transferring glycine dehydrogenase subunit GcvPA, partial [Bacteroidota bacterium]
MKLELQGFERFDARHNAPDNEQISKMLKMVGANSIDELIDQTIPQAIRLKKELDLPLAKSEYEFVNDFKKLAQKNKIFKSYIGAGYYNTIVPPVILRNILENPGWYTAYTPYQAEIAQGRLEALINYQTMVIDLTGMEIANASLLDEGTAAAEAMTMLAGARKGTKKNADKFFIDKNTFPQTLEVLKTRAIPVGIDLVIGDLSELDLTDPELYGILLQYPDNNGEVKDHSALIESAKDNEVAVAVATDLMSLLLLTPPGEMGADVVIGTSQRFGVPMGYGGPHAAFFATKEQFKRQIPGRIIGASLDAQGNQGYRMALQTREQHIRREKATSNICTAQVLLAVMSGMYAVYHGPEGLKRIATRIHTLTKLLDTGIKTLGLNQLNAHYFDTLKVNIDAEKVRSLAEENETNFRYFDKDHIGISLDETTTPADIKAILFILSEVKESALNFNIDIASENIELSWPSSMIRSSHYLAHPVFSSYQSEHEMLRYIKKLENKDLSLVHSMISLGSCTMKLNATSEMIPVTWQEFGGIHPFAPQNQTGGY